MGMRATQSIISRALFTHDEVDAALADAGTQTLLVAVPASRPACWLYLRPSSNGACRVQLFEGPTQSAAGNARTPTCRNRTGTPPASAVVVTEGPTVSVDGTALLDRVVTPGSTFHDVGHLLNSDTEYLVRITNVSGGAAVVSLGLDFEVIQNLDQLRP